jgi:dihydrofolate reductase
MSKIISFVHISLDGFVAAPNGEMDWITVNQEIFDYVGQRINKTNTALYGRITYQMMESYWPDAGNQPTASKHDIEHSKWYNNAHKVVLSTTMRDVSLPNTEIISENLLDRITALKQQAGEEVLVFGSPTATHSLIQENLIDGYCLLVNPIILGRGIPLFVDIKDKTNLTLVNTHQFTCGVTELNYIVDRR